MVKRKGLGKGKGKGYKNIVGKDPKIHSDSSKGRKQPQKLSPRVNAMLQKNPKLKDKNFKQLQKSGVFLKYQGDADKDGVKNIKDCKPLDVKRHKDEPVTEIKYDYGLDLQSSPEKESYLSRKSRQAGKFIKKEAVKGKTALEHLKERREKARIKELSEIDHPIIQYLDRQKERVDEIKTQIAEAQDEDKEEKLFDELATEQKQLREVQEKVTNLKIIDFSDEHLKTLAIRYKDKSIFSLSNNPYTEELKRRIKAEKTIEKELDDERKKKVETGSLFGI